MTNTSKLAKQYQKKTDREQILDAPDTYIGSVEENDNFGWVFDPTTPTPRVTFKKFKWIPGLYKLFDEGIVNCRDHVIRMIQRKDSGVKKTKLVSYIYVDISDDGLISMTNDGNGIESLIQNTTFDIETFLVICVHQLIMIKLKRHCWW